jgi:hypothetical protein
MSLSQYAICVRVCAQTPDESIGGDMPINDDGEEEERVTLKLLVKIINVYTPLLVQDIKAMIGKVAYDGYRFSLLPY